MCGPQLEGIPQGNGSEGSALTPDQIFARNKAYLAQGAQGFSTQLPPDQEALFRNWVQQQHVAFDPSQQTPDYDMRGFWQALQSGDPAATSAINPNDNQIHYPDKWKTPYDLTFSRQSQWAGPNAPDWNSKDQLVEPGGRVMYDERARKYRPVD